MGLCIDHTESLNSEWYRGAVIQAGRGIHRIYSGVNSNGIYLSLKPAASGASAPASGPGGPRPESLDEAAPAVAHERGEVLAPERRPVAHGRLAQLLGPLEPAAQPADSAGQRLQHEGNERPEPVAEEGCDCGEAIAELQEERVGAVGGEEQRQHDEWELKREGGVSGFGVWGRGF